MALQSSRSAKDLYARASTPPRRCASFNGVGTHFYSAPTSPNKRDSTSEPANSLFDHENKFIDSNLEDFEFETSKKFRLQGSELENSQCFDYSSSSDDDDHDDNDHEDDHDQVQHRQQQDWEPVPEMAFADELFKNGLFLPLPPRLQLLHPSSPKSPSSMFRFPYPHRSAWNDDFDPFVTAMDNVTDGKGGKKIAHRRTQSFSPFKTIYSPQSSKRLTYPPKKEEPIALTGENGVNKGYHRRAMSFSPFRTITPSCGTKGWNQHYQKRDDDFDPFAVALEKVKEEKRGNARHRRAYSFSPFRIISSHRSGSSNGHHEHKDYLKQRSHQLRVKPNELTGSDGLAYACGSQGRNQKKSSKTDPMDAKHEGTVNESKGVKGFLMRYATFGGDKYDMKLKDQIGTLWKRSYLRIVSFRVKQHDQSNTKKKMFDEPKMEVAHYPPGASATVQTSV